MVIKNSISYPKGDIFASELENYEQIEFSDDGQTRNFREHSKETNIVQESQLNNGFLVNETIGSLTSRITKIVIDSNLIMSAQAVANQISDLIMLNDRPVTDVVVKDLLEEEAAKSDGCILKIKEDAFLNREKAPEILNQLIKKHLIAQGFVISDKKITSLSEYTKNQIRDLHLVARIEKYKSLKKLVEQHEDSLLDYFGNGSDIDLDGLDPKIEEVHSGTWQNDLFRYATLLWSVPVSSGFGRRTRFLVWDKYNRKLIGLFALGDPVFNLKCRDNWIGWNSTDRMKRLYNVMDVFVLGSVPPYNQLLGGKLISLVATSNEVRNVIKKKYEGKKTIIEGASKNPELALLTTSSALGKSSIYDRVVYNRRLLYQRIGDSEGWGHFHFTNNIFEDIRSYLSIKHPGLDTKYKFGQGPNWKLRTVRTGLSELGLSGDLLKHGIKREIYGIPLAYNFKEFLLGQECKLSKIDLPIKDLSDFFKKRWLYGRAERSPGYIEFSKDTIKDLIRKNVSESRGE